VPEAVGAAALADAGDGLVAVEGAVGLTALLRALLDLQHDASARSTISVGWHRAFCCSDSDTRPSR
jgi:hypothetical protein